MQLVHDFVVPRPIDTAWRVLTDLERIAPCMPGAQLTEVQGATYRGTVKVKVGPILAQFGGEARFKSVDEDAHRAVIEARGKEAGGKGLAAALITAQLTPDGDRTAVNVVTDLTLSGRIAQFGRGAVGEVSAKLLGQFAQCLESTVLADEGGTAPAAAAAAPAATAVAPAAAVPDPVAEATAAPVTAEVVDAVEAEPASATPESAPAAPEPSVMAAPPLAEPETRKIDSPEAEPVNLLSSAGPTILKRLIPAIVVVVVVVALIVVLAS